MIGHGASRSHRVARLLAVAGIAATAAGFPGVSGAAEPGPANSAADKLTGAVAPGFTLKTLDGRTVSLASFRGKVVLLNFWATWCTPCRTEMPWLIDFYRRYREQGLEVVGVALDDGNASLVARYADFMHVNYTLLLKDAAVGDAYGGVRYLPQTFFIGRDETILWRKYGIRNKRDFEADVQRALRKRAAGA